MVEIVGVGFAKSGKTYYFDPKGEKYEVGEKVIVETARGKELGHILLANREVDESELAAELKPIERKANDKDLRRYQENLEKRDEAMKTCAEKIRKHGLDMKLVDVEFMIDGSKIVFYFSADGRVDFRELAKDLASHFRNRIELRQIGVRDEARMLGGLGICGRPLCCSKWLTDFHPVSIKMAKQQNLSLNPTKISGTCGRLMCCLNFEDKTYKELRKGMPKDNERVETPGGLAKVVNVDYFNGRINTRAIEKDPETGEEVFSQEIIPYTREEIKRIGKNARKGKPEAEEIAEDVAEIASSADEEEIRELQELMSEF
ncbi:MAG: stage 0 sporulation protein [Clostridiales bacterium]|jgi:cell fate regulator YaaT (PSP1 superfamily)|nr:stage 0 sporulation protein [Clostridiales bacterium]